MSDSSKITELYFRSGKWQQGSWMGVPCMKNPLDAWALQQVIYKVKPNVIVELGTWKGGSSLFFASLLDLIGIGGVVITVDKNKNLCEMNKDICSSELASRRVRRFVGDSIDDKVLKKVKNLIKGHHTVLVDIDSDHKYNHVLKEMEMYGQLVTLGSYMIVEDGCMNGHPILPEFGAGPYEAIKEFLKRHKEFVVDKTYQDAGSFNVNGFLKKVK